MHTSVFDLFKIGMGPSSSHTVGPMRAAHRFVLRLHQSGASSRVTRLRVEQFGSLALTGLGHGTDRGVLLGLMGEQPDSVDPDQIGQQLKSIQQNEKILLFGQRTISFHPDDLVFQTDAVLPGHSNGMRFTALDASSELLDTPVFYSVGVGFPPPQSAR